MPYAGEHWLELKVKTMNNRKKEDKTYNSFTLIEMLVVIAIISILASMLSGPISRAIQKGREVACTNQLKQIGISVFQYQSPNMYDALPNIKGTTISTNTDTVAPLVALVAANLIDNPKMVSCPVGGAPEVPEELDATTPVNALASATMAGGTYNVGSISGKNAPANYLFTLFFKRNAGGSMVIAGDAAAGAAGLNAVYSPNHGDSTSDRNNGANALFGDGHVKTAKSGYSLEGYTNSASSSNHNPWSNDNPPTDTTTGISQIGSYGN